MSFLEAILPQQRSHFRLCCAARRATGCVEDIAANAARHLNMHGTSACIRVEKQFRRHHRSSAIVENAMIDLRPDGAEIAVPLIGARIRTANTNEMDGEMSKLF